MTAKQTSRNNRNHLGRRPGGSRRGARPYSPESDHLSGVPGLQPILENVYDHNNRTPEEALAEEVDLGGVPTDTLAALPGGWQGRLPEDYHDRDNDSSVTDLETSRRRLSAIRAQKAALDQAARERDAEAMAKRIEQGPPIGWDTISHIAMNQHRRDNT